MMTRIDNLTNCLTDIADAIREKTGEAEEIPVSQYDEKIRSIQSGGIDINGIIEEYKVAAGESVSAGDFVSFINKCDTELIQTKQVPSGAMGNLVDSSKIETIQLQDNKILLIFGNNGNAYAVIICFNGDNIIINDIYEIIDKSVFNYYFHIEMIKQDSFIMFYKTTERGKLYGKLLFINENQIILKEENVLISNSNLVYVYDIKIISEKNILLCYDISYSNNYGSCIANVMLDESNNISVTTKEYLREHSSIRLKILKIVGQKIYCVYTSYSDYLFKFIIEILSDGTIDIIDKLQLSTQKARINTIQKMDDKKFILFANDGKNLYAFYLKDIDGDTIVNQTLLNQASSSVTYTIYNITFHNDFVFVVVQESSNLHRNNDKYK